MSLPRKDTDEILFLLSRGWDERLTAAELARLETLLLENGEPAHELLLEFTKMHAELHAQVASSRAYERAVATITEGASQSSAYDGRQPAHRRPTKPTIWRRATHNPWLTWSLAACIALAVGVQAWRMLLPSETPAPIWQMAVSLVRPPQPIACIASVSGATWGYGAEYGVGDTLSQNQQIKLLTGTAQISMACGADVILQAPCVVTLANDDLVILEKGNLTAQVAKWATGFVVETKGLKITDLGTRFAVSADAAGVAEAHVLEGEVLAEPMKSHRPKRSSLLLRTGQGIRVSVPQATIDLIAAQRAKFIGQLNTFRPLRPIQIWNTGMGADIGGPDSHWTIVDGDPDHGPYPRPATTTPGDPMYLDNMPTASQWISVQEEAYPGIRPESVHTFETKFDLTGYDLATLHIVGLFLVDDAINAIRINGKPVRYDRWVTTWDVYDFKSFHPIAILDGFLPGENTISVDVYNSPSRPENPAAPNPMGLRVEWQAFGCEAE